MTKNVVLTCYFTGWVDEQRGYKWERDAARLQPLVDLSLIHI